MIPKKIKHSFCPVPWLEVYNTTLGTFGMCCAEDQSYNKNKISIKNDFDTHFNSEYMKKTRADMLNGIRPPQCWNCWNVEDIGSNSLRNRRNDRYEKMFNFEEMIKLTNSDGSTEFKTLAARLSVGKTCQLRCISCTPSVSTGVQKDYDKFGWDYSFKDRKFIDTFEITLKQNEMDEYLYPFMKKIAPYLKWLDVTGGEPTLSKKLKEFLVWCNEKGYSKNITISITTNGMTENEDFFNSVKGFSYSMLLVSIDGEGELDEYLRFPTRWERKIKNINFYKKFFNKVAMLSTIWSMNVNNLDKLINVSLKNKLEFNFHMLESPDELHVRHLPSQLKDKIIKKLESIIPNYSDKKIKENINDVLNDLKKEGNKEQWEKCLKIIKTYDKNRKKTLAEIDNIFINL